MTWKEFKRFLARILNGIVWALLIAAPLAGLVFGIIDLVKDPIGFLQTARDMTIVFIVLFLFFGLLGFVLKWTEKVINKK